MSLYWSPGTPRAEASELIPELASAIEALRAAAVELAAVQGRRIDPDVYRDAVALPVFLARDKAAKILADAGPLLSGDISRSMARQGWLDARELVRPNLAAPDYWTEHGPEHLASPEAIEKMGLILADLARWGPDRSRDKERRTGDAAGQSANLMVVPDVDLADPAVDVGRTAEDLEKAAADLHHAYMMRIVFDQRRMEPWRADHETITRAANVCRLATMLRVLCGASAPDIDLGPLEDWPIGLVTLDLADVDAVARSLQRVVVVAATIRRRLQQSPQPGGLEGDRPEAARPRPEAPAPLPETPDLVRLDQAAAIVHRGKRALERLKSDDGFPLPAVEGGGGKPHFYDWRDLGPFLAAKYGMKLPERFPDLERRNA